MDKINPIQEKILKLSETQNLSKLSLRDIGTFIGETHPQKVKHHLNQLIKKGLLNLDDKHENNLLKKFNHLITNSSINLINIPILGEVNCGPATLLTEDSYDKGFLKVSTSVIKGRPGSFALKAVGNSMNASNINGSNIEDGDYILVDSNARNPKNGDYVVSIIDRAANAKRIFYENAQDRIILISESIGETNPIVIKQSDFDTYTVVGKIFDVIKSYK